MTSHSQALFNGRSERLGIRLRPLLPSLPAPIAPAWLNRESHAAALSAIAAAPFDIAIDGSAAEFARVLGRFIHRIAPRTVVQVA